MAKGTKLLWKGNLGSDARRGEVTSINGDLVSILWEDGSTGVAPLCTIEVKYGWVIG